MLSLVVGPAAAVAEAHAGSATDPSGDQVDPQRDITAVSANYDTTGSISVTTTFRQAPTASSTAAIAIAVGTPSATGCGAPAAVLAALTSPQSTDRRRRQHRGQQRALQRNQDHQRADADVVGHQRRVRRKGLHVRYGDR
jgi:hypothetical protein